MKNIFFAAIAILFTRPAIACDCFPEGKFNQVSKNSPLVALVRVDKFLTFAPINNFKTPMSMEAIVLKVIKGQEHRKKITVWGDNGGLCRPYLSTFKPNHRYYMALQKGLDGKKSFTHKNEKTTDYVVSNCGEYWLEVKK